MHLCCWWGGGTTRGLQVGARRLLLDGGGVASSCCWLGTKHIKLLLLGTCGSLHCRGLQYSVCGMLIQGRLAVCTSHVRCSLSRQLWCPVLHQPLPLFLPPVYPLLSCHSQTVRPTAFDSFRNFVKWRDTVTSVVWLVLSQVGGRPSAVGLCAGSVGQESGQLCFAWSCKPATPVRRIQWYVGSRPVPSPGTALVRLR